ncbi:hypothetical protein K435DRAFT_804606 [Dendrothele bispora CBS 962.96]|uniref:Uncharacterized protein n=1 Tax=Dendrothele bispora (strain CBS 962.96) TaxID=1314807 RepID=A0A4S8LDT8_DENBC|nr:hypothetical protein K435DRAFT_804606 [Dendrothele bispora CBS 962.96]
MISIGTKKQRNQITVLIFMNLMVRAESLNIDSNNSNGKAARVEWLNPDFYSPPKQGPDYNELRKITVTMVAMAIIWLEYTEPNNTMGICKWVARAEWLDPNFHLPKKQGWQWWQWWQWQRWWQWRWQWQWQWVSNEESDPILEWLELILSIPIFIGEPNK